MPDPGSNPALVADCDVLLAARDVLAGEGNLNWSESISIRTWDGVKGGGYPERVAVLNVDSRGLNGVIPPELGMLTGLEYLALSLNGLTGVIPPELGNLRDVRDMRLDHNSLSGVIPPELGMLTGLEYLALSHNGLTGAIPPELGNLSSVRELRLPGNSLSGVIPPELGMLTELEFLDLSHNQLTGAIPPQLGNLSNVRFLRLSVNMLSDGIPVEFGNLTGIETLDLGRNQLTGEIPRELADLPNLQRLYLALNYLTGEVPVELTQLTNLQTFHIIHNRLSGCVPDAFRELDTEIGTMRFCGDPLPIWQDRPTFEGGVDLGVAYIERLPRFERYRIAYFSSGDCPYPFEEFQGATVCPDQSGVKRWPDPGEAVELIAHVWNFGDTASGPFDFEWKSDDRTLMKGLHEGLESGESAQFALTMEWPDDAANPMLTFAVDTQDQIGELIEHNNTLADWVKGYTLGVFFSPEAYESLRLSSHQGSLIQSPEYWVHSNMGYLNGLLARAGLQDRVRAELLWITEEEHLRYKNDLQWHMDGWWGIWHHKHTYFNLKNYTERPSIDWGLLHELMHQLGVIDIYRMHLKTNQVRVPDVNRHGYKAGCGIVYWGEEEVCFRFPKDIDDLMTSGQPFLGTHTAGGLRTNTGQRRGFYGEYLYDTPAQTTVMVVDKNGTLMPDVTLRFHQSEPVRGRPVVDATPEFEVTSDESGLAVLPNRGYTGIVTATGHQLRPNPFGAIDVVGMNGLFLIEMEGSCTNYEWLTIVELNLAYWDGHTDEAVFTKVLECPPRQTIIGF